MDENIIIKNVWLDESHIFIETSKGEIKSHPLEWFPKLFYASKTERQKFELSPFGIHWEDLDEDLSFEGFFSYTPHKIEV